MPVPLTRRELLRLRLAAGRIGLPAPPRTPPQARANPRAGVDTGAGAGTRHAAGEATTDQAGTGLSAQAQAQVRAAVRHGLAFQAQDLPGTLWALALRAPDATRDDVRAAFGSQRLVRSWAMRGTWHAMRAEDLAWLLRLTGPRALASRSAHEIQMGLDQPMWARAEAAARELLAGGRAATKSELRAALVAAGIPTGVPDGAPARGTPLARWYRRAVVFHLAVAGVIALGPFRPADPAGQRQPEQCWVLLDDWAGDRAEDLSPEAATRRLVWRYLGAHGPASERDLAWWCHLPLSQLRPALRSFRDGLRAYAYRGETLWARADTVRDAAPPAERIMLLPGFDELLLGYQDRSATLAPAHAVHVTPHNNGIFRRTVTRDGRVIALWNARPGAGGVTVEVTGLSRDLAERDLPGLRRAATRYARYLGLPKARVQLRAPLP